MNTRFINFQRKLRQNMPLPEVILWQIVRRNQLGVKFRRQYVVGNRILDFYAPAIKLGIEVDGESHFINEKFRQKEIERDIELLKKQGIKILRFLNSEIRENLEGVVMILIDKIRKRKEH